MKYLTFPLYIILSYSFIINPSAEKTLLNIEYEFKYLRDIDNKNALYKSNMILSLGMQTSRFVEESVFKNNSKAALEDRKKRREQTAAAMASSQSVSAVGQPVLHVTNAGAIIKEEIFIDKKNNKLTNAARIGFKNYYYTSAVPILKWDLKTERKKILGYDCQKATTSFGGRFFEVWFTTALPYSYGPWKLQGLPGLILEAVDSKNEVLFIAKEISKNTDADELMIPYMDEEDGIKVKEKEYKQTSKMFVQNPESIVAAQFPNAKISIRNIDNRNNKTIVKVKKYNPMELR